MSKFGGVPLSKFGGQPVGATEDYGDSSLQEPQDDTSKLMKFLKDTPLPKSPTLRAPVEPVGGAVELPGIKEAVRLQRPRFKAAEPSQPRTVLGEFGAAIARGLIEAPTDLAAGIGGFLAGPALSRDVEDLQRSGSSFIFQEGPRPTRDDTAGTIANFAGGFIPQYLEGVPGFAAQGYKEVLDRTDDSAAGIAGLTISAGLSLVPLGKLASRVPAVKKLIERVGEETVQGLLLKQTVESLAAGTANVGIATSKEGISRFAGAAPEDIRFAEEFLGGAIGHLVVTGGPEIYKGVRFQKALGELQKYRLIKPEEIELIGERPGVIARVSMMRSKDYDVTISAARDTNGKIIPDATNPKLPKLSFRVTKDIVTQAEKKALGFSEPFIDAYREYRAKGGEPFFVEPTRLPVTPDEQAGVTAQLAALRSDIAKNIQADELSAKGLPISDRALLLRDAKFLQDQITQNPTRMVVDQAKALLRTSKTLAESRNPIPESLSIAAGSANQVVTPLDLRPTQDKWIPLPLTIQEGYLKPSSELAKNPSVQRRIDTQQRRTMDRLTVLQENARLPAGEKIKVAQRIDAEHVEKMSKLIAGDTDNATGTRAKVAQSAAKTPEIDSGALSSINSIIEDISKRFPTETQLGTMDRLIEVAQDPKNGLDAKTLTFLRGVRQSMLTDETFMPWGVKVRETWTKLREVMENLAGFGLEPSKQKIIDLVKELPSDVAKPFLEQALTAKTIQELDGIGKGILLAQEVFLRKALQNDLQRFISKSERNPQRSKLINLLRRLRVAEAAPTGETPTKAATGKEKATGEAPRPVSDAKSQVDNREAFAEANAAALAPEESGLKSETRGKLLRTDEVPLSGKDSALAQLARDYPGKIIVEQRNKKEPGRIRFKVYDTATPTNSSSVSTKPETIKSAAIKFRGVIYEATSHYDAIVEALMKLGRATREEAIANLGKDAEKLKHDATPIAKHPDTGAAIYGKNRYKSKLAQELLALKPEDNGFVTSEGRFVTREEAAKITEQKAPLQSNRLPKEPEAPKPEAKPAEPPKPTLEVLKDNGVVTTDKSTGYEVVDLKALKKLTDSMPAEEVIALRDRVREIIRRGQIEQGLYKSALKYSLKEDVAAVNKVLRRLRALSDKKQTRDTARRAIKYVLDPVMIEASLEQASKSDRTSPLYQIFHATMVDPYNNHLQNIADTRRFAGAMVLKHFGFDSQSVHGQYRLAKYLAETLESGVTRDKAMRIYAWSTDEGRKADLEKVGVETDGKSYPVKESVALLSENDKAFVDEMKAYFQNNPFVEKAFNNVTLLMGHEPRRVSGWFASSRTPERTELKPDFDSYATSLMRDIDPLRDRADNLNTPYNIDNGFFSAFMKSADKLSLFGELGRELFRSQTLYTNREFERTYKSKRGKADYTSLGLYLGNIAGQVGHSQTAFDAAVNKLVTGTTISRVGLNIWSAAKQYLHIFTMIADGTLSPSAIGRAVVELSPANKRINQAMQDNSGLAYLRYTGGQYMQNFIVQADAHKLPSKLTLAQHYSMVLQRTADRHVMQIAWRAAELSAKQKGLEGLEARQETQRLFNIAAGRDQPTDNPLYASELEIQAKRSPLFRGSLLFAREQNRIYNVIRRNIVRAVQQPTTANVAGAARAIMFGAFGNAIGVIAINQLRNVIYDRDITAENVGLDALTNVTGMFYLAAPVDLLLQGIIDTKRRTSDQLLSPTGNFVWDLVKTGLYTADAIKAGDEEVKSGASRGLSKETQALGKAAESALSASSTLLGLPLWALWNQGKGLYVWTDDQYRLMLNLQVEKESLKNDGQEKSARYRQLEQLQKDVNEIHHLRQSGLLDRNAATQRIVSRLQAAGL